MRSLAAADAGIGKLCSSDTGQEKLGAAGRAGRQPAEAPLAPQGPLSYFL